MLGPLILANADIITDEQSNITPMSSKTYQIDFETGEILSNWIDSSDAVVQMAEKIIKTARDTYIIYSSDIGSEVDYLLGNAYSDEYLNIEIPRLISEALLVDDRIQDVNSFVITRNSGEIDVTFNIVTNIGDTATVGVTL